jgi:predicted transcriptional regulator
VVSGTEHATPPPVTSASQWTLLTNHGHVLVCIARQPDILLADIAAQVGIRERAAHRIVNELVEAGYLERTKNGRRNHYAVCTDQPMRHPLEEMHNIGELLTTLR